jgi:hypothetical protein
VRAGAQFSRVRRASPGGEKMRRRKLFEIHLIQDAIAKKDHVENDALVVPAEFFELLNAKLNEKQTEFQGVLSELLHPETD